MALNADKVAEQIGRRIAELRQQRGWSQQDLADRLRATFQWISQVEGGQNLTVHSLVKVANGLKTSLQDLLEPPDPANKRAGRGRPKKSAE